MARRCLRIVVFVAVCLLICWASGSTRVDPAVLDTGRGYYQPEASAAAAVRGTIEMVGSGSEAEDTGYPILLQVWALSGRDGSPKTIAGIHNAFALASSLALGSAVALLTRRLAAGWLSLSMALLLRSKISVLLFGALDNRTFIIFFPLVFVILVVVLPVAARRVHHPTGFLLTLGVGIVVETAALIRHSEGLIALSGLLVACALVPAERWRRVSVALLIVASGVALRWSVPAMVSLWNDVQTGNYHGEILRYLRPTSPPAHSVWHALVTSIGRYPNEEGLLFDDDVSFAIVEKTYPDVVRRDGRFVAARAFYFRYLRLHPWHYLRYVLRGLAEDFFFVPYVPSVGNLPWFLGCLPAKEGVIPGLVADPRDVVASPGNPVGPGLGEMSTVSYPTVGYGSLINLRLRYLRLSAIEWAVYLASIFSVAYASMSAIRRKDAARRAVLLSLSAYVGLGALVHALIPTHGQAFSVAHWATSIVALSSILFRPRSAALGVAEHRGETPA